MSPLPKSPLPNPAQAHPQLPRMKFSCFVGPSVPEPGRVKRREASCGAEGSGVEFTHPSLAMCPEAPLPGPLPHSLSFRSYLSRYLLFPHSLGAYCVPNPGERTERYPPGLGKVRKWGAKSGETVVMATRNFGFTRHCLDIFL